MAIQLGSAYGKVEIDGSGVTRGVNSAITSLDKLSSVATALGGALQNIGRSMTIGLTLPILAVGAASIKLASDMNETRSKVKVVFGDMAEDMTAWADNASETMKMPRQEALEAAATFGNLFDTMGLGEKQTVDMSKAVVQLAADLSSMHNITPEEALQKLRSGLVGEVEPLRSLGVLLTESAVKAKAMEMGLVGVNGELSEAAKVQARYALIMEQTVNAQGDAARTGGELAGQMRELQAKVKDAMTELGENFLPVVLKVVTALNFMLEKFINLPEPIQNAILVFAGFLAVLGPILSFLGTIISIIGGIASLATTLSGLGISLGAIASVAGTALTALVGVGAAALSVVLPILIIIGTLALLYLAFKNNFMGITTTAQQLWFILKFLFAEGWKWLVNAVKSGATTVLTWFKNMVTRIMTFFRSIKWSDIGKYIVQGIVNGLIGNIGPLVAAAKRVASAVKGAFDKDMDINSPSGWFEKRGIYSVQGYMKGLSTIKPEAVSRAISKPITREPVSNHSNTMNFAYGLTLRDVDNMLEQKLNRFTRSLGDSLGGA